MVDVIIAAGHRLDVRALRRAAVAAIGLAVTVCAVITRASLDASVAVAQPRLQAPVLATPVAVDADADTWVEYVSPHTGAPVPDMVHGAELQLNLGLWDTGTNMEGLVRFGPPPPGWADRFRRAELWLTIDSAESISHARDGSRAAAALSFSPALDAWDEAVVLGTNRPRLGAPEATAVASAGLLKLDFTAPARAWLDGTRPNGWVMRAGSLAEGGTMGVSVGLDSRETAFGPKLALFAAGDEGAEPTATASATPTAQVTPGPSATATGITTPTTSRATALLPWAGRASLREGDRYVCASCGSRDSSGPSWGSAVPGGRIARRRRGGRVGGSARRAHSRFAAASHGHRRPLLGGRACRRLVTDGSQAPLAPVAPSLILAPAVPRQPTHAPHRPPVRTVETTR